MSSCPESDVLVTLAGLADDPAELLQHVTSCDECTTGWEALVLARTSLGQAVAPRAGFSAEVMSVLEAEAAAEGACRGVSAATEADRNAGGTHPLLWLLQGTMAAGVGVFTAGAAGSASPGALGSVVLAAALAGAVGLLLPFADRSTSTG